MRSRMRPSWLANSVLALSIGVGACQGPTEANRQLDVSVSVDRTEIAPGTAVNITVTVTNRGSLTVQTADPHNYDCFPAYQVLDAAGRPQYPPGRFCDLIGYLPRQLAPGESLIIHDAWSGVVGDGHGNGGSVPVAPGQYRIFGRVTGVAEVVGGNLVGGPDVIGRDPVLITVRPAGAP